MARPTSKFNTRGIIREWYHSSKNSFRINESQDGVPEGMMRVTGVAAVIGVKNRNNRIYTEQNYLYWVDKLQEQIKAGRLFGELEHPESDNINNNNISHKIEALWYDKPTKRVMITLLLLDTEKGKIAQSIIRAGGAISVSSRANGSVNAAGIATIDDLITYDIVGTPGFTESELYLSESVKKANIARFKSSNVSECMMFVPQTIHNSTSLREALSNTYFQNSNNSFMKSQKRTLSKSVASAKRILESRRRASGLRAARLTEGQAAQVQNWVLNEYTPTLINYLSKAGMIRLNESTASQLMSFGAYANRIMNYKKKLREAEDEKDPNECNENEEPQNGEQVLEPTDGLKDQVKAAELKERWERKAKRLARKIREAEEDKKDAEDAGDDEKAEEIQETIDDLQEEQDELQDKIDELEKKIDESKRHTRIARRMRESEEDEETLPQTLTDEELDQLSDDELEQYIEKNENAATDDEEPEVVDEDDDEPQTPGEAEEKENECGDPNQMPEEVESPFMTEEEDPNDGEDVHEEEEEEEETPANECDDPNQMPEEVESPFISEARRRVKAQSRLVESIRRRSKKKPLR